MVDEATTTATDAPAESETPGGDVGGADDLTALRRALDEERKQRRAFERSLKEITTARQQEADAKKTDVERLTAELAALRAERDKAAADLVARDVRDAVVDAATRAGARRPIAVYKLIADELETGDDGKPSNVGKLIESLKKAEPDLFRSAGSADGAARGLGTPANADMNALLRRAAGRG